MPAILMACVAAIIVSLSLAACSSDSKTATEVELAKRGFTDARQSASTSEGVIVSYGTAGTCRFRIDWERSNGYILVDVSTRGEANNLTVVEPTVVKLRQLPELAYCFEEKPHPSTSN